MGDYDSVPDQGVSNDDGHGVEGEAGNEPPPVGELQRKYIPAAALQV